MNLQVNEPTRRPGQPLCQDPWPPARSTAARMSTATSFWLLALRTSETGI